MKKTLIFLIFTMLLCFCKISCADVYGYTDNEGKRHLTNFYNSEECKTYGCIRIFKENTNQDEYEAKTPETTSDLNADDWFKKGYALAESGNYTEAIIALNKAIDLDPQYTHAFYNRGNIYFQLSKKDEAMKDLSKAIELDPQFISAYFNRATIHFQLGKKDEAIKDLSKVIELDPKHFLAYMKRAVFYQKLANYQLSIKDLSLAVELDPKNADAYAFRAIAYYKLGNEDKATADIIKAAKLGNKVAQDHLRRQQATPNVIEQMQKNRETHVVKILAKSNFTKGFAYKNVSIKPLFGNFIQLIGEIKNKSGRNHEVTYFDISLYDASDNLVAVCPVMISNFRNGQTKSFSAHVEADSDSIKKYKIDFSAGM